MSTTLPLFWNLSSASKKERLGATVKLVSSLEHFQSQFVPKSSNQTEAAAEDSDASDQEVENDGRDALDSLNSPDVAYSIRRLCRGLASPRESSRLGFAVALTELLSRIDTVTCSQILNLIIQSTKSQGSITGQEERDILFARLFGITSIVQSGLLLRTTVIGTSEPSKASLEGFKEIILELVALGDKKSWLRESSWWTISLALDALQESSVEWKQEAIDFVTQTLVQKSWSSEKVALVLKLQELNPSYGWSAALQPMFKSGDLLSNASMLSLARILKDASNEPDASHEESLAAAGSWKPELHYVWTTILDRLLPTDSTGSQSSFPEFFRIVVDESLFSSTSSPERKYWGFQVFQLALPRVTEATLPMLFTKNLMRSWINHLSKKDRHLHKIAIKMAEEIQSFVQKNPQFGFALILQLTGVHGSQQFDKLTRTKTVETILTSMDADGIKSYLDFLVKQINQVDEEDVKAINARRSWVIDQMSTLIRNGAIPKSDGWVQSVLEWLTLHGLFILKKKSEKSPFVALRSIPRPPLSDDLMQMCRTKLSACLADLTTHVTAGTTGSKNVGVTEDGSLWTAKVMNDIETMKQDTKHLTWIHADAGLDDAIISKAVEVADKLHKIEGDQAEAAQGAEILIRSSVLEMYCSDAPEDYDVDGLETSVDASKKQFLSKKSKKSHKSVGKEPEEDEPIPVDVLTDAIIGYLEKSTAQMRTVANHVFGLISGLVEESTLDLILEQLQRKDPSELLQDDEEDSEMEVDGEVAENEAEESEASSDEEEADEEDSDDDAEVDEELRNKIAEALKINGADAQSGDEDSDEELMDDDQMMAIDEQLAQIFKARVGDKSKSVDAQREATHFKNRVLDLLDTLARKQPSSPLILRMILPLVDLVTNSSVDEKHLSDKAQGILKSRIGKSKEHPSKVDLEQVTTILQELHSRARKARSTSALPVLTSCSLYVSRVIQAANAEVLVGVYSDSLRDFITRKNSSLNTAFFKELIHRYPGCGWLLRNQLVELSGQAVNHYRQTQVYQLLYDVVNQLSAVQRAEKELVQFMSALQTQLLATTTAACAEDSTIPATVLKEVGKLALLAVRQSRRLLSSSEMSATWDQNKWEAAAAGLKTCTRFSSSTALQKMFKQVAQMIVLEENKEGAKATKRKAQAIESPEEPPAAKKSTKRKKSSKTEKA